MVPATTQIIAQLLTVPSFLELSKWGVDSIGHQG
jgi:hypothetical protein